MIVDFFSSFFIKKNNECRQIVLLDESSNSKKFHKWAITKFSEWDFIFFSDNYLELKRWKKNLGNNFNYIQINDELEQSARQLREPYLLWISQLGQKNLDAAWWASRISERNTAISTLYEDICRLKSLRNILKKSKKPVLIVIKNKSLKSILLKEKWLNDNVNFNTNNFNLFNFITYAELKKTIINFKVFKLIRNIIRILKLFYEAVQATLSLNKINLKKSDNVVLVHTYIDETNFLPDGKFSDRYFPGLEEYLRKNKFEVLVLPVMFNINRSYRNAWSLINKSCTKFINPFKFYQFEDYIFALCFALRSKNILKGAQVFEGTDITPLIKNEISQFAFDTIYQILYIRLPLRLKERGVNCLALIAEFENMIPEKMLIIGFREYQPETELIGFQHGAVYPNLLTYYLPFEERGIAPMYDRVVCNGNQFRQILISQGLDKNIAVVGAALRYEYLLKQPKEFKFEDESKPIDIFVPLPLMLEAGVELLDKLINAFSSESSLRILLKAHPMSNINAILSAANIKSLPNHFHVTKEPVNSIISKTRLMVGLSTCTMFEAVAAGVPVVRLHRETALDLDPLSFWDDLYPFVTTETELSLECYRILNFSFDERKSIYDSGRKMLINSFQECNDESLSAFLPTGKNKL